MLLPLRVDGGRGVIRFDDPHCEFCPVCKGFEDRRVMVPVPDDGHWHGRCFVGARGLNALLAYPNEVLRSLPDGELHPDHARSVTLELARRALAIAA